MHLKKILLPLACGVVIMMNVPFGAAAQNEIRKAAVAGQFYENNPTLLRTIMLRYLADGKALPEPVRLLICPHAGFVFSGPVAAKGYATIDSNVKRVFIIGPSHHEYFQGIAVSRFDYYETPLGKVPIDRSVVDELRNQSGVVMADGFDEPEHCLEVQIPFLQVQLPDFSIVPILTGKADPRKVAEQILPYFNETTAVIASSDLSHYKNQSTARKIDDHSINAILTGNENGSIDACGELPIRVVMHLAKKKNLHPIKLDARTSYETAPQHCDNRRVVGYVSIAYVSEAIFNSLNEKSEGKQSSGDGLSGTIKRQLLQMARKSLEASVKGVKYSAPGDIPAEVKENSGCFVTLTIQGRLRGCIGYIEPIKPLYQAVIENAKNAALNDPRFPRVTPNELDKIKIEISVLTKPKPLPYKNADDLLEKLAAGRDGVILRKGSHQSTYLPQVWEQLPDKVQFLEQLSLKGRMPRDGWKTAEVKTYQALHFKE